MLAYNWPGNVREIERLARLVYRDKLESESSGADTAEEKLHAQIGRFHRLDGLDTPINKEKSYGLLRAISGFGGDGEFLESLLIVRFDHQIYIPQLPQARVRIKSVYKR